MKPVALSLSVLLVATWPDAAVAEKADRDKPAHIEADSLSHDDLKQVSIFTGRAVLTKGTLVLRGARIEIREDADGYQHGVVLPEAGKRAFFRQKREGLNEFLEAEGARIDYDGRALTVNEARPMAPREGGGGGGRGGFGGGRPSGGGRRF